MRPPTTPEDLRIALCHEWLDAPGGAEHVLTEMLQAFPQADVWSSWCLSPAREQIPADVQTTWLARTPFAGHKAAALPLLPLAWRTLPRRSYDAVLTSSYGVAHAAHFRGSGAVTLHYIHTPARYWWTPGVDGRGAGRLAAGPRAAMRGVDRWLVRRDHDVLAANSAATRERIRRYWKRDASVIYPPVDTDFYRPGPVAGLLPFDTYVLGASRWVPYKRLDLVILAAEAAGLPVVIAGNGPMEHQLRQQAAEAKVPVHFERQPSRERLRDLYRGATALIFPVHEDFGIVPVEAMACGTPVVGPAVGGLLESVRDGRSGILVPGTTPAQLAQGVAAAAELGDVSVASEAAARFSKQRFRTSVVRWVLGTLSDV